MKVEGELKEQIAKKFNKRVITLLFYDSRAFNLNVHENSEYDFILVLDRYEYKDNFKLNNIVRSKFLRNFKIEINLVYKKDMDTRGKENFQMRTSLSTYYNYLENISPLLGENIFAKYPLKISKEDVRRCCYFKIQEYYGRCDKILVNQDLNRSNLETVCKYTKEMVRMLLLSQPFINVKDITKLSYDDLFQFAIKRFFYKRNLSESIYNILKNDYTYIDVEYTRRLIYEKYLKLLNLNNL